MPTQPIPRGVIRRRPKQLLHRREVRRTTRNDRLRRLRWERIEFLAVEKLSLPPVPLLLWSRRHWLTQGLQGPTCSAVVKETASGAGFKPPAAPVRVRAVATPSACQSGSWADPAPYGSVSVADMPDMGFVRKVKGMMEGTGSPAADRFGQHVPRGSQFVYVAVVSTHH